jgi:hypothetical protein
VVMAMIFQSFEILGRGKGGIIKGHDKVQGSSDPNDIYDHAKIQSREKTLPKPNLIF